MIDWDTVDLDAPWQPRQFAVGERVRVRLSGECRRSHEGNRPAARAGLIGHDPREDGMTGTVDSRCQYPLCVEQHHIYLVWWEKSFEMADCIVWGACYTASELEPLADGVREGEHGERASTG